MKRSYLLIIIPVFLLASCGSGGSKEQTGKSAKEMDNEYIVQIMTVDPGHFHAGLVQKKMYDQVSPDVNVYAPEGPDVVQHLNRIKSFNERADDPTKWNEIVYTGNDFFEKMLAGRPGNVVVLSGNNRKKAEYITRSVNAGLNVFADKPMIISPDDFPKLEEAFRTASEKGVLIYDIMTERYEITTIFQKLLSLKEEVFGKLEPGTMEDPAVTKVSVHHFLKLVAGAPNIRPGWFFDVEQQGEGIVDVTTHLVDLVQWECFPEQILSPSDVTVAAAKRWPTIISKDEFKAVTNLEEFPGYLQKDIKDGSIHVFANGEIVYQLKGIWAKVSVEWRYQAPPGAGDTHFSMMHGSKCDLVIRQGADQNFKPTLYAENVRGMSMADFTSALKKAIESLPYEDVVIETAGEGTLKISIPDVYKTTHEDHFGQVTEKFLEYMEAGKLPEWEVPGMITKYYTTTTGLKKAKE
ncbi:MAG TPA: putative oxidoreductase C-terminal domain-containing protein [Bacteroidales bacterium]|nr:putative oxidoreductase C-terminal domain-containing protein [Bacteroidales bacterium]HPF02662.1 putative oxidoreductase C-terminal domain-containing protein [Bacteroidales bacterium]HPJ60511.1 putative oxidoreductase C-terminal domain-containing protein [Bacteroidales bacterium]HPR13420.1 putative oxidoreductase C-terminal domain-containing protein [Bacteroidales bacterium]HRW84969.1 putative oxidoreductase C-terminal domain-containing protein [Bacteroidales bacterium]